MGDVIQCPTCSKKFRLSDRPPAVFTCTACGTPMDLSAFRGAAAAAVPSAAPEPPAAPEPAPGPVSHGPHAHGPHGHGPHGHGHGRPHGGRGAHAAAARAMRARRGQEADDEEGGEEDAPRFGRPKKNNNALIIGSLVGLVVILGIVFLAMSKKEREAVAPLAPVAAGGPAKPAVAPPPVVEAPPVEAPSGPPKPTAIPIGKTQVHEIDHHPEATAEEKDKIDKLIDLAIFQNAGSDSRDAGTELVKIGMKAVPRLINAFHKVKTGRTFDDRLGRMEAGIADGLLRKIDGYMERVRKKQPQIKAHSTAGYAETTARMWVAWWDAGAWKAPQKPWDPAVDGPLEDEAAGGAGD